MTEQPKLVVLVEFVAEPTGERLDKALAGRIDDLSRNQVQSLIRDGLITVEVQEAPHDCLRILYADDDKLFLPVENIELLSRYGSEEGLVHLDRLGGAAWQARKARMKRRVRDMSEELIRVAAERAMQPGETMTPPQGSPPPGFRTNSRGLARTGSRSSPIGRGSPNPRFRWSPWL